MASIILILIWCFTYQPIFFVIITGSTHIVNNFKVLILSTYKISIKYVSSILIKKK